MVKKLTKTGDRFTSLSRTFYFDSTLVLCYNTEFKFSIQIQQTTLLVEKMVRPLNSTKTVVSTKKVVCCSLINRTSGVFLPLKRSFPLKPCPLNRSDAVVFIFTGIIRKSPFDRKLLLKNSSQRHKKGNTTHFST